MESFVKFIAGVLVVYFLRLATPIVSKNPPLLKPALTISNSQ